MSTRCNVLIQDEYSKLWFYRHSDGYPSTTGKSLKKFLRWLIDGKIRDNVGQASGWLILMGAAEYSTELKQVNGEWKDVPKPALTEPNGEPHMSWKCGAYEPSFGMHGDIEYLYVVDLVKKELRCYRPWDGETPDRDPFATVTAANIDQPIGDDNSED